jgi:hypothetical protein
MTLLEKLTEIIADAGHKIDFKHNAMLNSEQNNAERSRNLHVWKTVVSEPIAEAILKEFLLFQSMPQALPDAIEYIQQQIRLWIVTRLGQKAMNLPERGRRAFEESAEVGQALGVTREEAHRIVDHVFDKPVGQLSQELGGAALTLLACAEASKNNLGNCVTNELARIHSLPKEKFQKRQEQNILDGIGT